MYPFQTHHWGHLTVSLFLLTERAWQIQFEIINTLSIYALFGLLAAQKTKWVWNKLGKQQNSSSFHKAHFAYFPQWPLGGTFHSTYNYRGLLWNLLKTLWENGCTLVTHLVFGDSINYSFSFAVWVELNDVL